MGITEELGGILPPNKGEVGLEQWRIKQTRENGKSNEDWCMKVIQLKRFRSIL